MSDANASAVIEQVTQEKEPGKKPKRQPRYHVVLWDDPEHTYDYVIRMMKDLFHMTETAGRKLAEQVDKTGRAICLTTTMELAELKRDQIKAFGADPMSMKSKGSMYASIEPAP